MDSLTAATFTSRGYTFRGRTVPEQLVAALDGHVQHGRPVDGFLLKAILENDLKSAMLWAHEQLIADLPAVMSWLYQEAPSKCWGTPERVEAWRLKGGLCGASLR